MYYTVVLNKKKLERWLAIRRKNGSKINMSTLAAKIGYSKSYFSRLLNSEKYGLIEISARFIGTMKHTFNFDFDEIFDVVRVRDFSGRHPQERWKDHRELAYKIAYQKHFKRRIGTNYYGE